MTLTSPAVHRSRAPFPRIVTQQFRSDLRCFWRNTQSRFFTVALPVLLLLIFGVVFRNTTAHVPGGLINESIYYVPAIITFGLIAATFSNLMVTVVQNREVGIYKRRRATPVPASAVIIGRVLVAVMTALAITGLLLAIGWATFGASIPGRTAPAFVLTVIVGAVVFCCLGFGVATFVSNADAAQPVVQAIVFPLCFISGVFVAGTLPNWLVDIAKVFPVRALHDALLAAYNPHISGSGLRWGDLAVLAAWGAAALVIAIRRFSWLPSGD